MTLSKHYKKYWIISYYSANLSSASILFPFLVSLRDLILVICLSLSLLTKKFFDTCLFLLDLYYCIVYTFVIEEKLIPSIYHTKKNFLLGFTNLSIYRLTFLSCKRCPQCTEVRIICPSSRNILYFQKYQARLPQVWSVRWHDVHWTLLCSWTRQRTLDIQTWGGFYTLN